MSVPKIAAGVFLGNLFFSIIAGIVLAAQRQDAMVQETFRQSADLEARLKQERYERCLLYNRTVPATGDKPAAPCRLD